MRKIIITSLVLISCISSASLFAADEAKSKFDCVLTDTMKNDKTPGDKKDTFSPTTPEIYLVCSTAAVKKGDVVKGTWVAIDTKKAAPDNYQIAEKAFTVENDSAKGQTYDMSLSKPDKGWPVGTYKVDLYLNDKLAESFNFSVAK